MIEDELRTEKVENLVFITFPIWKLIVLNVLTLGFYELFWFYKYWKTVKETNQEKISPFWRALFSGISCFWLFPILEKYIIKHNIKAFSGIGMAITYLILCAMAKAPEPVSILGILAIVPIIMFQLKINEINKNFYPNAELYQWTWKTALGLIALWLIFALIVFLVALSSIITNT